MTARYVGTGQFIPGVPARDLSDEEVERFGEALLLASGLYERTENLEETEGTRKPGRTRDRDTGGEREE